VRFGLFPSSDLGGNFGSDNAAPGRRVNANRGPDHKEGGLLMAAKNPMDAMDGDAGSDSNPCKVMARRSDG
jgi:hypothetical protein